MAKRHLGAASPPPLIEFRNVTKIYGRGEAQVRALAGVNLTIEEGEFAAVMGPSGSGKSTSMNIIGCLDQPTGGSYLFKGVDVSNVSRGQRALLRRNVIGFVFQGFKLLARTNAVENVELPLIYRGMGYKERRTLAMDALDRVGLLSRALYTPGELSGGQQQRVAIARAIVGKPQVLLADEPTGNLDSKMGAEVMDILLKLNSEGTTVIMVSHDEREAQRVDRIVRVFDGQLVA